MTPMLASEKLFLILSAIGIVSFLARTIIYALSNQYSETSALTTLLAIRLGAAVGFSGLAAFAASRIGLQQPLPIAIGLISGGLVLTILAIFSRHIALAISKTLQREEELRQHANKLTINEPSKEKKQPI